MTAENITVECDEDGFYLVVDTDDRWRHRFRITDPDALYDSVCSTIGEWIAEREEARRTAPVPSYDPSEAYEATDPKRPVIHYRTDYWDNREGK